MLKAKVTRGEQDKSQNVTEMHNDFSQAEQETHQYVPSYRRIAGRNTAASFKPKRTFAPMKPDFDRIPLPDKDAVDSDQTVQWEAYVQHLVKGQEVSPAGDMTLEQMLNDLSFFEFQGDALKLLPSKKERVSKPKQRTQLNAFKSI